MLYETLHLHSNSDSIQDAMICIPYRMFSFHHRSYWRHSHHHHYRHRRSRVGEIGVRGAWTSTSEWVCPDSIGPRNYTAISTHTSMLCIRVRPSSSSIHLGVAVCMACIKTLPNFITKQQQKRQKIKNDNNNYRHPEEMTAHKLSDNKTRTKDCVFSGKAEILGNMERVVENRKCHKNSFSQNPEENRNNKERQQI